MKTTKMSLANIQGKLSRAEMKNIMAGSGAACLPVGDPCTGNVQCCSNVCSSSSGGTTGASCGKAQ